MRLIQALANGGALDYYLIGRLDNHEDRSGFAPVREIFRYHAVHEDDYHDLTSQAQIGVLNKIRGLLNKYKEAINPRAIQGAPEGWDQEIDIMLEQIRQQIRVDK